MPRSTTAAAAILLAGSLPALADVSYTERISTTGLAATGGGGLIETKVEISGMKRRTESEGRTGGVLKHLTALGVASPAEVVLVGADRVYGLDPRARRYTEETLAERKGRLDRVSEGREPPMPFREVHVELEPTGRREVINGFSCEQILLKVSGNLEEPVTKQQRGVMVTGDLWVTDSFPGKGEIERFHEKYAEGLGLDVSALKWELLTAPRYAEVMREFARQLSRVGGFPIRTTVTVAGLIPVVPAGVALEPPAGDSGGEPVPAAPAPTFGGASAAGGGGPGSRRLVTRFDVEERVQPSPRRDPSAEWTFVRLVGEVREAPVAPARFDPPEDYKRLVPKSRRKSRREAPTPPPAPPAEPSPAPAAPPEGPSGGPS